MGNKFLFLLFIVLLLPPIGRAELIQTSRLKATAKEFAIIRNLFYPAGMPSAAPAPGSPQAVTPEVKKTIEQEIRESVKFEGFTSKDSKKMAILNVSGEYQFPYEGDVILDKIKIVKITEQSVTIEYEGVTVEIFLEKGNENG